MVLEDAVEALEQAVVGGEKQVARADAASLGDDRLVLVLRQFRHLERLELARWRPRPSPPTARRSRPSARSSSRLVLSKSSARRARAASSVTEFGADVDVAVQDPDLGAQRRRHGEEARAGLVERGDRPLEDDGVERVQRLGGVQRLLEPEPALLEGAASLAEADVGRVQLLPPLASGRNRHLERAGEASAESCGSCGSSSSHAGGRLPGGESRISPLLAWRGSRLPGGSGRELGERQVHDRLRVLRGSAGSSTREPTPRSGPSGHSGGRSRFRARSRRDLPVSGT